MHGFMDSSMVFMTQPLVWSDEANVPLKENICLKKEIGENDDRRMSPDLLSKLAVLRIYMYSRLCMHVSLSYLHRWAVN